MKYQVLSRSKAKKLSYKRLSEPTVIISITDIESEPVSFARNPQIKSILRLSFDDVGYGESGAMEEKDAERIAEFCLRWLPDVSFVVHCEMGVSRSAGVCAAILKHFEGKEEEIFSNAEYSPNMHCYGLVVAAFERYSPDQEIIGQL